MTPPTSPCPYPPEFLAEQRGRLLAARRNLETSLAGAIGTGSASSSDPASSAGAPCAERSHEAGSIAALKLDNDELQRGITEASRRQLAAVNAALERMEADRYGWDAEASAWLPMARLAALPTASTGISDD